MDMAAVFVLRRRSHHSNMGQKENTSELSEFDPLADIYCVKSSFAHLNSRKRLVRAASGSQPGHGVIFDWLPFDHRNGLELRPQMIRRSAKCNFSCEAGRPKSPAMNCHF
jgi:hypothetical protein